MTVIWDGASVAHSIIKAEIFNPKVLQQTTYGMLNFITFSKQTQAF